MGVPKTPKDAILCLKAGFREAIHYPLRIKTPIYGIQPPTGLVRRDREWRREMEYLALIVVVIALFLYAACVVGGRSDRH